MLKEGQIGKIIEKKKKTLIGVLYKIEFDNGILTTDDEYIKKISDFEVGDKVETEGGYKGEIIFITGEEDIYNENIFVNLKVNGNFINDVYSPKNLTKIDEPKFEVGDKVKNYGDICTVKYINDKKYKGEYEYAIDNKRRGLDIAAEEELKKVEE